MSAIGFGEVTLSELVSRGGSAATYSAALLEAEGVPDADLALVFDPQTAGGLLVSLPAERARTLGSATSKQGARLVRIGAVGAGAGNRLVA